MQLDDGQSLSAALSELRAADGVAYAEPNYLVSSTGIKGKAYTSDDFLTNLLLWGIIKVKAPEAWDTTMGAGVVVAVTDSGIEQSNPELAPRLWSNYGEVANGIDDDDNGIVDDIHGADFVHGDGSPDDEEGHGTHVSGTIAAGANDGYSSVGVAPQAQIMALKFLDGNGNGNVGDAISAIDYAVENGARVINASWGGAPYSKALEDAIVRANNAGAVVIVAAGNEGIDNDIQPSYPASYTLPNMVTVAATNKRNRLAAFSNYGTGSVDIAAPGVDILSNVADRYESWSGTSMATPHVSGIAALLAAHRPDADPIEVADAIRRGAKPVRRLENKLVTGGVANAVRSLLAIDQPNIDFTSPDLLAPSRFRLRSPGRVVRVAGTGKVKFRWTAARDDDFESYEIYVDGRRRGTVEDPDTDGPRKAKTSAKIKVSPGNHRWTVVAVDEAGNKRVAYARGGSGKSAKLSVKRK